MKKMQCEVCGSNDLIKQDGYFLCQSCGCKYTVDEAKALLSEIKEITSEIDNISKKVTDQIENSKEKENHLYALLAKDNPEIANYRVLEYLRDADYVSDDIFDDLSFGDTKQKYAIVANFGGPITYHWTASSGYDREEIYTDYEEKAENIDGKIIYKKVPVTKTRIVTDWKPSNGTVNDYYSGSFVVNSSDFYNDVDYRILIGKRVREEAKNALSLWKVLKNIPNGEGLYNSLKSEMENTKTVAIGIAERSKGNYVIPGDRYKDVNSTADFKLEIFNIVLYPIFCGEYTHKHNIYKFTVDAIDGNKSSLFTEHPIQSDDKQKHKQIISKAESQKRDKILKKQKVAKILIGTGWAISVPVIIALFFSWAYDGKPSLLFPLLILIGVIIWHYAFKSKFKNDIANIIRIEDKNIFTAKLAIEKANQYKRELRQNRFIDYINNCDSDTFNQLSNDFIKNKGNINSKIDNGLSELENYEEQQRIKDQIKETSFPERFKALLVLGIICLSIGGGLFVSTILNIIEPTKTKLLLGILGTALLSIALSIFCFGNWKIKKTRKKEGVKKKSNSIAAIISAIFLIVVIITECFSIATPAIKKAKAYSNAANLVEAGDYIEAIKIYDELNDTAKVQEYISFAIQQQVQESKKELRNSTVGQLIKVEDYEAMVIDKKQDRILIAFTRYCGSDSSRNINTVYKMSYDNSSSRWETSSIRSFLNETFLDEFPESTKNLIIETELQNHTKIGKDDGTTKDRVFILSFLDDRTYIDKLLSINGFWASPTFTRTPSGESELVCIGVENHFDGTGFHYSIESYDVKNNFYITPCAWLDIS